MTGVIFATNREAAPFLDLTGQRQDQPSLPAFYAGLKSNGVLTIISGMGPTAAGAAALMAIADFGVRRLINAGICGALQTGSDLMPGTVFSVNQAAAVDLKTLSPTEAVECSRQGWDSLPSADLVTCDRPLFDANLRDELAAWGALVDMEGAAVAAAARGRGVPCTLIKGVTDLAAEGERVELHRRLESVSRKIAKVLSAGLHRSKPISRGTS